MPGVESRVQHLTQTEKHKPVTRFKWMAQHSDHDHSSNGFSSPSRISLHVRVTFRAAKKHQLASELASSGTARIIAPELVGNYMRADIRIETCTTDEIYA